MAIQDSWQNGFRPSAKGLRFLSNIPWPSQCDALRVISFGSPNHNDVEYDFHTDWTEWYTNTIQPIGGADGLLFYLPEVHQLPVNVHKSPIPTIAIISDWNLNFVATQIALKVFDAVLVDFRGARILRSMGHDNVYEFNAYGLHVNSEQWNASRTTPPLYDLLFIGNISPGVQKHRGKWLRKILALRDKLRVRVETQIYGDEYVQAMASTRVVFNHSIRGEANMRVFETMATNGFVLLEAGNQEIGEFLEPNSECILYPENEFEQTLQDLLSNPCKIDAVRGAAKKKQEELNATGRWRRLAQLLEHITDICAPQQKPELDRLLEWMQWTVPVRKTPIQSITGKIDERMSGDVSCWDASQFIARCVLELAPTQALTNFIGILISSLESKRCCTIWDRFHFAQVLAKAGEESFAKELEVLQIFISELDREELIKSDIFPFYTLPSSRHFEFQAALWNHIFPNAIEENIDLKSYLRHWAMHRVGELLIRIGEREKALAFLRSAALHYSEHAPTWIRISHCLSPQSIEYHDALQRAFDIDPMNADLGLKLLEAKLVQKRMDEARCLAWEQEGLLPLQIKVYQVAEQEADTYKKRLWMLSALAQSAAR